MDPFGSQPQRGAGTGWVSFDEENSSFQKLPCPEEDVELNIDGDVHEPQEKNAGTATLEDADSDSVEEESLSGVVFVGSAQPRGQKLKWVLIVVLVVAVAIAVTLGVTLSGGGNKSVESSVATADNNLDASDQENPTLTTPSPSPATLMPIGSTTAPSAPVASATNTSTTGEIKTASPATATPIIQATVAPVAATSSPVSQPTEAPVAATKSPIPLPTDAPVVATESPTPPPTDAPVAATEPPIPLPTDAPVAATEPPILQPTDAPVAETARIKALLQPFLSIGTEFDDPTSYQSQSLSYLESVLSSQTDEEYKVYFALASIYYASSGVPNKRTLEAFADGEVLLGWISSANWVTDSSYCTWFGVSCNANLAVTHIELAMNRLYGIFPPEVRMLKDTLETIDLFSNTYLVAEGDAGNSWIAEMSNLRHLFFGTTSFEYYGIPTFIGQLPNLEEVDFSNSFYSNGPIRPEAFSNNPMLSYVTLSRNTYTSTVPSTITNHPGIEYLYLQDGIFDGVKQSLDFLVGMPSLTETWNDFTQFGGGLPTELGTVSNLVSLSLTFCTLTGTIPTELGNLGLTMDRLWLYQNLLTGTIPAELANLSRMQLLFLEGNRLSGTFPEGVCSLRTPLALLANLGTDCETGSQFFVDCPCCSCCGPSACGDFD